MFRGIDPIGLNELATELASRAWATRRISDATEAALLRNRCVGLATELSALTGRFSVWAGATEHDLRWRAEAMVRGQTLGDPLLAQFAIQVSFAATDPQLLFARWKTEQRTDDERIGDATEAISTRLSQSWNDRDVTNNDLQEIENILRSLDPTDLSAVITSLTPRQLGRWVEEMGHQFNGFSREEKQSLFAYLAEHADGVALGAIHEAALTHGGFEETIDLGHAIAQHAADSAIAEFVAGVVGSGLADREFSGLAPAIAIAAIEGDDAATKCLQSLNSRDGSLKAVVLDAIALDQIEPGAFHRLVAALARATDGNAVAFSGLVSLRADSKDKHRAGRLRSGMNDWHNDITRTTIVDRTLTLQTALLLGNLDDTIQQLATEIDPSGEVTTEYWRQMVDDGRSESIAAILRQIRGGADLDLEAFATRGDDHDYSYPRARNLAFVAATVNRGLTECAENAADDIEFIKRISGVAMTVVGLMSIPAEAAAALIGLGTEIGIDAHADGTIEELNVQLDQLIDNVTDTLVPTRENVKDPSADLALATVIWTDIYRHLMPNA